MIARFWHGWTTPANADAFQDLMTSQVVPAFEARHIAGLMQIDLLRRHDPAPDGTIEFITAMIFDTIEAVERFAGEEPTRSIVPPEAHALLARCDTHSTHYGVVNRRVEPENARGRP